MNYYMKNLVEAKKDLFTKEILRAKLTEDRFSEYEIEYFLKRAKIEPSKENLCVAVIGFEKNMYYFDNSILNINNFISEFLKEDFKFILVPCFDKLIIIAQMFKSNRFNYFVDNLKILCKKFQGEFDNKINIGVADDFVRINNLKDTYKSANNMLRYKVINGMGNVFYSKENRLDGSLKFDQINGEFLVNAIKDKSEPEIVENLKKILSKVDLERITFNDYKLYIIEIINNILSVIKEENIDIEKIFGENLEIYDEIEKWNSINDAYWWLKEKAIAVSSLINVQKFTTTRVLLEQAKYFIEKNYTDNNLSVKSISEELHVSSTYLSTIFKKEMNLSIVAYITKLRLEKSKNLLKSTNRTACSIAELVGYSDSNYFSYVFKKEYGVSPSKYR